MALVVCRGIAWHRKNKVRPLVFAFFFLLTSRVWTAFRWANSKNIIPLATLRNKRRRLGGGSSGDFFSSVKNPPCSKENYFLNQFRFSSTKQNNIEIFYRFEKRLCSISAEQIQLRFLFTIRMHLACKWWSIESLHITIVQRILLISFLCCIRWRSIVNWFFILIWLIYFRIKWSSRF